MNRNPKPLVYDAAAPEAQRALLRAVRSAPPVDYDVEAGVTRLLAGLEASSGATIHSAEPLRRASSLAKLKLALLVLPVGVLTLVGHSWLRQPEPSQATSPAAAASERAAVGLGPERTASGGDPTVGSGPPLLQAREATTTVAAALAREAVRPRRGARPKSRAHTSTRGAQQPEAPPVRPTPTGASTPQAQELDETVAVDPGAAAPTHVAESIDELQAIARARRLLASSPRLALALLERVGRAHPRGYFVEEREALEVLALYATGERKQADRQAQSFLQRHPQSPYLVRIRNEAAR